MERFWPLKNSLLMLLPENSPSITPGSKHFLELLLFLIHITSGLPARGTELTRLKVFNDGFTRWNFYIIAKTLILNHVSQRSKAQKCKGVSSGVDELNNSNDNGHEDVEFASDDIWTSTAQYSHSHRTIKYNIVQAADLDLQKPEHMIRELPGAKPQACREICMKIAALRSLIVQPIIIIVVLTDHNDLKGSKETKRLSKRQVRWTQELSRYDFTIEHQ